MWSASWFSFARVMRCGPYAATGKTRLVGRSLGSRRTVGIAQKGASSVKVGNHGARRTLAGIAYEYVRSDRWTLLRSQSCLTGMSEPVENRVTTQASPGSGCGSSKRLHLAPARRRTTASHKGSISYDSATVVSPREKHIETLDRTGDIRVLEYTRNLRRSTLHNGYKNPLPPTC